MEDLESRLKEWLGPTRAGRRLSPPVGGARVRDLVRAGRLDAIKTDLGMLISVASLEKLEREREESGGR